MHRKGRRAEGTSKGHQEEGTVERTPRFGNANYKLQMKVLQKVLHVRECGGGRHENVVKPVKSGNLAVMNDGQ